MEMTVINQPTYPPCPSRRIFLLSTVTLAVVSSTASAHHSFALFNKTKQVSIKGVVGRFDWANPHVTVYVDAEGKPAQRYKIETGSTNALSRSGWKSDLIKVGDKAEVTFNPLKNGDPGGLLVEIKIGGVVLSGGG